jgi:dTDP-4-dehydrorhamnose 3,5-epimerase
MTSKNQDMKVSQGGLAGILILEPSVFRDGRGFFLETFHLDQYREAGITAAFVQDNHARSVKGTIRGLHFQRPPGQAKLVRVSSGRAWDVVVDIRPSSPTYCHWEAFALDDERHLQIYIPPGFAHGYCAMSEYVDFHYKVDTHYRPKDERSIRWDDPAIGIQWPVVQPLLSERDQRSGGIDNVAEELDEW